MTTKMPEGHARCGMCGKVLPIANPSGSAREQFAAHVCRHGKKSTGLSHRKAAA